MKIETISLRPNHDEVNLTAYILDDSSDTLAGAMRPSILICPGGGYLTCSDREGEPVALAFAGMGYHVFVLHYSCYFGKSGQMGDIGGEMVGNKETMHPAPVQDVGLAMKVLNERADEWKIDTQRIAVCGFSAGSHNAAMYAVYWNKPLLTGFLGAAYRPAAAILCYGLSDYTAVLANGLVDGDRVLSRASNIALFGTEEPDEQTKLECSPAHLINNDMPPTFLWATAADELVMVNHSLAMAQGLTCQHIPFEMHIFEKGRHGLSLASQASAGSQTSINDDVNQWVGLAERWLKKYLELPLPKTTFWEQMLQEGKSPFSEDAES